MQAREKKLAIALGGVVGLALAWNVLDGWILAPLNTQQGLLNAARVRFDDAESKQLALRQAQARLRDWRYDSLPPDDLTAQREYQKWLRDLAVMSGWSDPQPFPGQRGKLPRSNFVQIPITLEGRATLEQVARFLYHCERVALLHRIDQLKLVSPTSDGNPLLTVTLKAVGLSLPEADDRPYLFPRAKLTADLAADATSMSVEPPKQGFPLQPGFQVKLGNEFATVTKLDGEIWTIERAVEGTAASAQPAGSDIELFPLALEAEQRSFNDYELLLKQSPFTKPTPPVEYQPQFTPATLPIATRGTPWEVPFTVTGWNPAGGAPVYSLVGDVPRGLHLDAKTGKLTWNPPHDVPAGQFEVSIRAASPLNSEQSLTTKMPLVLREPNVAPVVEDVPPVNGFSGRPITLQIEAVDPDGEQDGLSYALTGTVPEGAKIDVTSGLLTWTPPLTLELGDFTFTVTVTDKGDPPQTVNKEVKVKVAEDAALFTRYAGYVAEEGKPPEAFLYNQATKDKRWVRPGDALQISDIHATVAKIDRNFLDLEIGSEMFRWMQGKNLRQLLPLAASAAQSPTSTQ